MANMSNFLENRLIDGILRGGAVGSVGGSSSAVSQGAWQASTAYSRGDIVVPHANMVAAGGKFMRCFTAGTSGATNTLTLPAIGSNMADGTVLWTAISGIPIAGSTPPALFRATAGKSPRSTAVTVGQSTIPATSNGRMYLCTTAGTTGAGEPTWGTTNGGTTADGTAVWTEMTPDIEANSANFRALEVPAGVGYSRDSTITSSLLQWNGTQDSSNNTTSTGTGGTTSNRSQWNFGTPTADWGFIALCALYDEGTNGIGNLLFHGMLTAPKYINAGDSGTFPAGTFILQIDN